MQRTFPSPGLTVQWCLLLVVLLIQGAISAQTLQDFGFGCRKVNGVPNLGTRPLLLIVANFAGETNTARIWQRFVQVGFQVGKRRRYAHGGEYNSGKTSSGRS